MENTNVHTITVILNSVEEMQTVGADNSTYSKKLVLTGRDKYSQLETRFELKFDQSETASAFWNKMASIVAKKADSEQNNESTYIYEADVTIFAIRDAMRKAEMWDEYQQSLADQEATPF